MELLIEAELLLEQLRAVIPGHIMTPSMARLLITRFAANPASFLSLTRGKLNHISTDLGADWRKSNENEHTFRTEIVICLLMLTVKEQGGMDLPVADRLCDVFKQSPFVIPSAEVTEKLCRFYALMKLAIPIVAGEGQMKFLVESVVGPLSQPGIKTTFVTGDGPERPWTVVRYLIYEGLTGRYRPKNEGAMNAAGFTDINGLNSVETTPLTMTRDVECAWFGLARNDDEQSPPADPSVTVGPDSPATFYRTVGEQDTDQESVLGRRSAELIADHRWERDSDVDTDESIQSDDPSRDGKRRRRGSEDDPPRYEPTEQDIINWVPLIEDIERDWDSQSE